MRRLAVVLIVLSTVGIFFNCEGDKMEKEFRAFIERKVPQIQSIEKARNLAYWNATISGKEELFSKYGELDLQFKKLFSDSAEFDQLKNYKESGRITEPLLARQLELLYNAYLKFQIDSTLLKEITALESAVENKFSVFRGTLDGQPITNNEILEILKAETDSKKRQKTWEASKMVGVEIEGDLLKLVRLRNQAAEELGFKNYYSMSLTLAEQDEAELLRIFDDLKRLTDEPFRKLKAEIDAVLAERYGTIPAMLRPWHYHDPFFQEAPMVLKVDLDKFYADRDVRELGRTFYDGLGLRVDSILAHSDLYEKPGKNPHAYCTHIDRAGDVRVFTNLKNNVSWMETLLHELGHAVYDKYMDFDLPYMLREPAHPFTTEAIAMFFGRLARNAYWMRDMLKLSEEETNQIAVTVNKALRMQQLIFSRWCQVMFRFERELYANPDQDLNKLWWDLVEEHQLVTRPSNRNAPDWAAKIHFTMAAVYYHNYMLGELMASQLHAYLAENILKQKSDKGISYVQSIETGNYLRKNIFEPGTRYHWNNLLQHATNESLNPKYFVMQFVDE